MIILTIICLIHGKLKQIKSLNWSPAKLPRGCLVALQWSSTNASRNRPQCRHHPTRRPGDKHPSWCSWREELTKWQTWKHASLKIWLFQKWTKDVFTRSWNIAVNDFPSISAASAHNKPQWKAAARTPPPEKATPKGTREAFGGKPGWSWRNFSYGAHVGMPKTGWETPGMARMAMTINIWKLIWTLYARNLFWGGKLTWIRGAKRW